MDRFPDRGIEQLLLDRDVRRGMVRELAGAGTETSPRRLQTLEKLFDQAMAGEPEIRGTRRRARVRAFRNGGCHVANELPCLAHDPAAKGARRSDRAADLPGRRLGPFNGCGGAPTLCRFPFHMVATLTRKQGWPRPVLGSSFIWAVSGALLAARRGYDLTGIGAVALVSATGGGLLRDNLFLQQGPPRFSCPRSISPSRASRHCSFGVSDRNRRCCERSRAARARALSVSPTLRTPASSAA